MPVTIIRPATPADLPALGRLGALLVRTHHDFDPRRFIDATPRTERGYAAYLGSQLGAPGVIVLVAEDDGEVLGYAYGGVEGQDYMSLRGPAGVLHDLVVDPSQRGRGVGQLLLERRRSCSRPPSATRPRSDCSRARASGGRWSR